MNSIQELTSELFSRLPELEWKITRLNFSSTNVPRGLFRLGKELTGAACVTEIKEDIHNLSIQNNERSAHYLAERIKQKINVLVILCQMDSRKKKPLEQVSFGIKMLSTRQQWLQSLEHDIHLLTLQQQALSKALEQMKLSTNTTGLLNLKAELGEVERRLTLAQEALKQAV
jgi:hypothetical protein